MSINRVNITRKPHPRSRAARHGQRTRRCSASASPSTTVASNPQTGEWEDYPNFIDCTMFGARAESSRRYLSKGTKVCRRGQASLQLSGSAKRSDVAASSRSIVDEVEFMSSSQEPAGCVATSSAQAFPPVQQAPRIAAPVPPLWCPLRPRPSRSPAADAQAPVDASPIRSTTRTSRFNPGDPSAKERLVDMAQHYAGFSAPAASQVLPVLQGGRLSTSTTRTRRCCAST